MTHALFNVLVVEDDESLRQLLCTLLKANGYRHVAVGSAARALIEVRSHRPDLALVDLGLPDRDGVELVAAIREQSGVPILILSARTQETEKVRALDAGADDYVTKPFSPVELLARVRAALRRTTQSAERPPILQFAECIVDLATRTARTPDGPLHLTPIEYRLLACLAQSAGLVVPQRRLMAEAWGPDKIGDTRSLRFHVSQLRQKLEPDPRQPRHILTEPGVGYRLLLESEVPPRVSGA